MHPELIIRWNKVENAKSYEIQITKADGTILNYTEDTTSLIDRGECPKVYIEKTHTWTAAEVKVRAVGKNYGRNNLFGTVTNANSISIEMCSTNGKIADATYRNTVELTIYLMNKYGISASNLSIQHFECELLLQCPYLTD